jgi:Zn-finger nucleic acid-binding protein
MSDRITLRCPSCGAPLPASAANHVVVCGQCNTASEPAPRAPERVERTVVVERVVVAADQKVTPCPRCSVGLFGVRAGDVVVNGCGVCGGIWLDNVGSVAVVKNHDPRISALAARAASNAAVRNAASLETLACPVCHERMQRVNVPRVAELDVCKEHGTWFDAGELNRITAAYHTRDDDPLKPIAGTRDPVEARLQHLAESTRQTPIWEGPVGDRIAGITVSVLGAVLAGAAAAAVDTKK